ncbi:arabinose ABC transporter substrate-binding protein, partial [Pseudomonas veronii]
MKKGIRVLAAAIALSGFSALACAEEVKIGFLVKQAEEPWFQTEWAFAE